ncbi:hypothetical protein [Leptolyngbya ohadii]|uniref:hypothetical protein n=1 Tax=Leptolyngbya ohadii TaxID=1962290 RepID=UPI00117B6935|nr:hypothetical protein [Leptolyngbya ohadii]
MTAYAQKNGCSVEWILEKAIVHFFDQQGTSFEDCHLELPESYQRALEDLRLQDCPAAPYPVEEVLEGLPDKVTALLTDEAVLSKLTPRQVSELAIAQFLQIKPVSFSVSYAESPGAVREQERILQDFLDSTRPQMKHSRT